MTESMMGQFVRFMRFCNRRWVKWPTVIVFLTAITVAHFVMADKYGVQMAYKKKGPVLYVQKVEPAEAPADELVYF